MTLANGLLRTLLGNSRNIAADDSHPPACLHNPAQLAAYIKLNVDSADLPKLTRVEKLATCFASSRFVPAAAPFGGRDVLCLRFFPAFDAACRFQGGGFAFALSGRNRRPSRKPAA